MFLVLMGCSAQQQPSASSGMAQQHQVLRQIAQLEQLFGQVRHPAAQRYLTHLAQRLAPDTAPQRVVLLDGREPWAASIGGGTVVLSRGMLLAVRSEAELAFVVAHELAHGMLGHHDTLPPSPSESIWHVDPALEQAADARAVQLLAQAGFDPRASISALQSVIARSTSAQDRNARVAVHDRIAALAQVILRSHWSPHLGSEGREFRQLQQLMRSSARAPTR